MADEIQGIDPAELGEEINLLLPYPYSGTIAMKQ
jgi:hypothetical protein